jgi:AcrR family transcriptional regulator
MSVTVRKPRRRTRITSARVLDRRGQVWEQLLAVAGGLMAEHGIAAVSVEQILLGAGISRGTFYGYCRNKSDLVVAIVMPVFAEGTAVLERLAGQAPGKVVDGIIALYQELWRGHRNALLMIPAIDAATFSRLRVAHGSFTGAMQSALERAAAGGRLRSGSAALSFRVISRTAVPLLRVYDGHPDGERLYQESMAALLTA